MTERGRKPTKAELVQTQNWFKVEETRGVFYTPFFPSKKTYKYAGKGDKNPSPKELVDLLTDLGDAAYPLDSGNIVGQFSNVQNQFAMTLPGGVYAYREESSKPERLVPFELREDKNVILGDIFATTTQDVKNFLDNEKVYTDHGLIYKLGVLCYGPQGCGKTVLIRHILKTAIPKDAVVIYLEKDFPSDEFIFSIKETLADRIKVFVFEELAAELSQWFIGKLLTFLDGELSVPKSITLATTNYPEKLPGNIVDRPSRFDKVRKFDYPKPEERRLLYADFLGREPSTAEIELSNGLSIADIKESSLLVLINKVELADAIKAMKARMKLVEKAFAKATTNFGFGDRDD